MSKADKARVFRSHWSRLADLGDCDAVDGSQFRRAWQAFKAAQMPSIIPWLVAWLAADEGTHLAERDQNPLA